ncbi:MAG: EF-P lysine aminoacylase EpmA [Kiritimatiellia bacterium]|jgi:lysyl-tRNA synthetase class 2
MSEDRLSDTGIPSRRNLLLRAKAAEAVRAFFRRRGYLEVETPVRVPAPAMEAAIDAPPSGRAWLRASPELPMKRMVAAGFDKIFQLGPCFREGERGARHNPEFTMLEWYRAGVDCDAILRETLELLAFVARRALGRTTRGRGTGKIDFAAPVLDLTMEEAFRRWSDWNPVEAYDADRFDADLVSKIEPALPHGRPCVLRAWPAATASLARLAPSDPRTAERWELYLGGLELANAYTELTDAAAQRARFLACAEERRAAGREVYPLDEPFLQALERGMPACGGIALGFDRLVMLLCGEREIEAVRPFCPQIGLCW